MVQSVEFDVSLERIRGNRRVLKFINMFIDYNYNKYVYQVTLSYRLLQQLTFKLLLENTATKLMPDCA